MLPLGIAAALVGGATALAQVPADFDDVERSMAFVEQSAEATNLLNTNQPEAALAIFEALEADYADLDEDGLVATAIGDCLVALGRDEEARVAYRNVAANRPDLAGRMTYRLVELELAAEPSEALLDELRLAAETDDASRYTATWQLGRALQKRAAALLAEAATAFDTLSVGEGMSPCRGSVMDHAETLRELANELQGLIERMESRFLLPGRPRVRTLGDEDLAPDDRVVTEQLRSRRIIRLPDERRIEFETTDEDAGDDVRITADGRPLALTRRQTLLIKRYTERINAILLEAADTAG